MKISKARWWINKGSLYYSCNFYVCLSISIIAKLGASVKNEKRWGRDDVLNVYWGQVGEVR